MQSYGSETHTRLNLPLINYCVFRRCRCRLHRLYIAITFSFDFPHFFEEFVAKRPEARDRLARQENVIVMYSLWRRSVGSSCGGGSGSGGRIEILADLPEDVTVARTPFRWGATAMTGTRVAMGVAATGGVGRTGGNLYRSPPTGTGRQNVFPRRGRGRGTTLPSWYPRRPLRDITAVVRRPRLLSYQDYMN